MRNFMVSCLFLVAISSGWLSTKADNFDDYLRRYDSGDDGAYSGYSGLQRPLYSGLQRPGYSSLHGVNRYPARPYPIYNRPYPQRQLYGEGSVFGQQHRKAPNAPSQYDDPLQKVYRSAAVDEEKMIDNMM